MGLTLYDFEALKVTSLAYWIGVARGRPVAVDAGTLSSAMSYQYDIEEQAGRIGYVFPPDANWRTYFRPIGPVQLTCRWSPIPTAIAVLGQPSWLSRHESFATALACQWDSSSLLAAKAAPRAVAGVPDSSRFLALLSVAAELAVPQGGDLLLVAKPGWSYTHGCTFDEETRSLMQRARFAVLDRRAGGDRGEPMV